MSAEATVSRQLPRLAAERAVAEEDPGEPRHHPRRTGARRGSLWPHEGQGSHHRVSRCTTAREEAARADSLSRRASRGGQDVARALGGPGHQPQVRSPLARRRPGRGRDSRPPAHLHRCLSRPDRPDDEKGGDGQPADASRRSRQDEHGLPGRSLCGPPRGARSRAEPLLPRSLSRRRVRPVERHVHRHRQRHAEHAAGADGPTRGHTAPRLYRGGEAGDREALPRGKAKGSERSQKEKGHPDRRRHRRDHPPLHP